MTKRLDNGKYLVGRNDYSGTRGGNGRVTDHSDVIVVRGDVVNSARGGGIGNVFGVSESKWYVVEQYEVAAKEMSERGGYLTTGSVVQTISEFVQQEFDTKAAAVKHAKRTVDEVV